MYDKIAQPTSLSCTEGKRESEITRICSEIEKALLRLSESIEGLNICLEPVLRSQSPSSEGDCKPEQPISTAFGKLLMDYRNRINSTSLRVWDLRQRVEL